ncbi:MAG: hypothetical protein KDK70_37385 [Myxococcales bacterium]|nr:hypothetical protein [Myxococcales bacterium]
MIYDWYRLVRLVGVWRIEVVTIQLPIANVLQMLPGGIELGRPEEDVLPGHHPFRMTFNWVEATMSWPPGFPLFRYLEVVAGIPYTYRTSQPYTGAYAGPFYYMPKVWTSTTPGGTFALGGLMWGIPKSLGRFSSNAPPPQRPPWQGGPLTGDVGRFSTTLGQPFGLVALGRQVGHEQVPIAGIDWTSSAPYESVLEPDGQVRSSFAVMRQIMDQPLLMKFPLGIGPWWVAANFKMTWRSAFYREIEATQLHVYDSFVSGLPIGTYDVPPLSDRDRSVGAYELYCPMELSAPSSTDVVGWTYPATTLLGPPGTPGVHSGIDTGD